MLALYALPPGRSIDKLSLKNPMISNFSAMVVPICMFKKGNPSIYIDDPDLLDENSSKEPEEREPEEDGDSKDEDDDKEEGGASATFAHKNRPYPKWEGYIDENEKYDDGEEEKGS